MDENYIKKEDLMHYGFYDESHKYVVCLNKEKLKEFFEADELIFEEHEHK